MYPASLVFLLAAVVSLFLGVRDGGLALVFVSIGCSVMSGLFLVVSVLRRGDVLAEQRAAGSFEPPKPRPEPEPRRDPAKADPFETLAQRGVVGAVNPPPPIRTGSRPKRRAGGATVLAIPERGTYHAPGCRFVQERQGLEELDRAEAKRRGFSACRICKPG